MSEGQLHLSTKPRGHNSASWTHLETNFSQRPLKVSNRLQTGSEPSCDTLRVNSEIAKPSIPKSCKGSDHKPNLSRKHALSSSNVDPRGSRKNESLTANSSPFILERSRKREASPFSDRESRRKETSIQGDLQEKKCDVAPCAMHSCNEANTLTMKAQGQLNRVLNYPEKSKYTQHQKMPYASNSAQIRDNQLMSKSSGESISHNIQQQQFNSGMYKIDASMSDHNSEKSFSFSISSGSIHEDLNSLCLSDKTPSPSSCSISSASHIVESNSSSSLSMECDESSAKLPFWFSQFPNVPPTLYFSNEKENVIPLPAEVRQLLLWKLTKITPILIRQAVKRSGYQLTQKSNKWVGTWSKHMRCAHFKGLKDFQKVNHYPGSFHLGRKDRLWRNISKMQSQHEEEFSFIPETFVLPQDMKALQRVWDHAGNQCWIIKPPASARGTGVHVIHKWSQIPKKQPAIVQRYLADPYLINGTKFDLRVYVLISSFDPLRIYVFDDGLVRFASVKYTLATGSLGDRFVHLTNYSINKNSSTYKSNQNESVCQGHKWTLKSLWRYFSTQGIDTDALWKSIIDIVIKTILSCESPIRRLIANHTQSRYTCFELFGFDIMLDRTLKPWLLEVNISPRYNHCRYCCCYQEGKQTVLTIKSLNILTPPTYVNDICQYIYSLHSASSLDISVKGQLVKDMLNIVGYKLPPKVSSVLEAPFAVDGLKLKPESVCLKRQLNVRLLSDEEKAKHRSFEHLPNYKDSILNHFTPDDIRHLVEAEDELVRCGHFQRVFPSGAAQRYLKFLNHVTYYNRLLDAWEQRYQKNRNSGIQLLQAFCEAKFHLRVAQPLTVSQEKDQKCVEELNHENNSIILKKAENLVVLRVGGRLRRRNSLKAKTKKQKVQQKAFSGQPLEQ